MCIRDSASGARSSELLALDIRPEYTVFRDGFVSLRHPVSFMPKVPSVTNRSREIVLQHLPARGFPLDRRAGRTCTLCPVRALRHYFELTQGSRRQDCFQLFVSFAPGKEGNPIRRPTLASWIVQAIHSAYEVKGEDLPQTTAHSTRRMATSVAWTRGASAEDICRAAT